MSSRQDQVSYHAAETKARAEEKTGQVMDATKEKAQEAKDGGYGAKEATKEKTCEAKDKASETAQAAKDRAHDGKEQTGSYIGQKTEAAKQKASETAQSARDTAQAGEEKPGSLLQQAGEQVKIAAVGAKDVVMNTLGMGGDDSNAGANKDTSTYKPGRDH